MICKQPPESQSVRLSGPLSSHEAGDFAVFRTYM